MVRWEDVMFVLVREGMNSVKQMKSKGSQSGKTIITVNILDCGMALWNHS